MVKRSPVFAFLILLLSLIGIFPSSAAPADKSLSLDRDAHLKSLGLDRDYHKCISVADGDTITLEGLGTVRLAGVDTPEKNHPKLPIQFGSRKAAAFIEALCLGKMVRLEYDFSDPDLRGNYGRLLGYVYLQDGTFLQEALIRKGLAIAYTKYPLDEDRKNKFLTWERAARERGVGLWRDAGLAEVHWILLQQHPLLQLNPAGDGTWEIIFGNWKSARIPPPELESRLSRLYTSIFEFSARDLVTWLADAHYSQTGRQHHSMSSLFIIGMSHRKWGILYENWVRPRVEQGSLVRELETLKDQVSLIGKRRPVLSRTRGGFLELSIKVPDSETRDRIARKFLRPDVIVSGNGAIIPWDQAGGHIGERMTVEGTIIRTFNSGRACFLNFHNNWTRYFSLVIFENVFHRFPEKPEGHYLNRHIRVRGKIKLYKGRPEMVVNHPDQITIVDIQ